MMVNVRPENAEDAPAIYQVNKHAFGRQNEADLVEAIRASGESIISLVALHNRQLVGHVLFTPVKIESSTSTHQGIALGPIAVLPSYQGQGIGAQLIEDGLQTCRKNGFTVAVVLGHANYYPRFGFKPAKPMGIQWEQDVPEDVFMVMPLVQDALRGVTGVVKYHPLFNSV